MFLFGFFIGNLPLMGPIDGSDSAKIENINVKQLSLLHLNVTFWLSVVCFNVSVVFITVC